MQQQTGIDDIADDAMLFSRYGQAIFAYIRLYAPSREDAEDLTLEVFTTALEHDNLAGLAEGEQLAWLRRVAHNRLIDRYRRATRSPVMVLDEVVEMMLEDDTANPEQVMLQRETYTQLHRVVQTLPQLQQRLLRLRYGDGLSFAEIAVLLNKREDALRKMLSRSLASLRTVYRQTAQEGGSTC
jgi:RNA polymerase sigma-70 factor (ECF subfamily)